MICLKEAITVARPAAECFDYVSDFRNTPEWDSTALGAVKLDDGPIDRGTRFRVRCRLPVGSVELLYTVEEYDAPTLITLRAECWMFHATDTIRLRETPHGTEISYGADFSYSVPLSALEGALRSGMERMGAASMAGLRDALENDFPTPDASRGTAVADRLLWPGLAHFTSWGYRRGRRRWNPDSTTIAGQRMVITGASSGLGYETARALAERGADLVLVMRDEVRAREVVEELRAQSGNEHIRCEIADLASMEQVDALARRLRDEGRAIDVLINNAGALFDAWDQTSEGLEQTFALLLLSPWRLTKALHPLLTAAPAARVINVVSGGMYTQKLTVRQLQPAPDAFDGATAYARCKRALMVVTEEWAAAWREDGITVNAMHPGWADTPGVEKSLPGFRRLMAPVLRSAREGADTIIWLAAAAEAGLGSGQLFLDREPRTTHLLSRTAESTAERQRLMDYLETFEELHSFAPRRACA